MAFDQYGYPIYNNGSEEEPEWSVPTPPTSEERRVENMESTLTDLRCELRHARAERDAAQSELATIRATVQDVAQSATPVTAGSNFMIVHKDKLATLVAEPGKEQ